MTDREMLELAAKAAGLHLCGYSWISESEDDEEFEILESAFVKYHQEQGLATRWNPLTDDGDALRLAVRLNILWDVKVHYTRFLELCVHDKLAATRRAITRAAAQIGKEME